MGNKPVCFVISPIGEEDSDTRRRADHVLKAIKWALKDDYDIRRGEDITKAGKIDQEVIRQLQRAEVCVADVSEPNPNVYFEVGYREALNLPMVLMCEESAVKRMPVDLGARSCVTFKIPIDVDKIDSLKKNLIEFIEIERNSERPSAQLAGGGIAPRRGAASASSKINLLAQTLNLAQEKGSAALQEVLLDQIKSCASELDSLGNSEINLLRGSFELARDQSNAALMDAILTQIRGFVSERDFLNFLGECVCPVVDEWWNRRELEREKARKYDVRKLRELFGEQKRIVAGETLVESAEAYIASAKSFQEKIRYLECLVGYLDHSNQLEAERERVEALCERLRKIGAGESPKLTAEIEYQNGRLYAGISFRMVSAQGPSPESVKWLKRARQCYAKAFQKSRQIPHCYVRQISYCYNLAECNFSLGKEYGDKAVQAIEDLKGLYEGTNRRWEDAGQLGLAYRIYYRARNEAAMEDVLARLREVDSKQADWLRDCYDPNGFKKSGSV